MWWWNGEKGYILVDFSAAPMVLRKYFRTHYVNIENARANAQHTAQHKHILFAFGETVYFAQIFTNEV